MSQVMRVFERPARKRQRSGRLLTTSPMAPSLTTKSDSGCFALGTEEGMGENHSAPKRYHEHTLSRKSHQILSLAWVAVLLFLHLNFWRPWLGGSLAGFFESDRLVLRWLPVDLCLRLGWMALAGLYLVHLTRCVWRVES